MRKKRGFSLIEIAVAIGILSLILGGMLSVYWQSTMVANRNKARMATYNLARAIIERYSDWNTLQTVGSSTNFSFNINNITYNAVMQVNSVQPGLNRIIVTINWQQSTFILNTLKADY